MKIVDFETYRTRFEEQYHNVHWLCGEEPERLTPRLNALYEKYESEGVPYAVAKAKILSCILENIRLTVNDFDSFAVVCERNTFLGSKSYARLRWFNRESMGEERWAKRNQLEADGLCSAYPDLGHTAPDWDAVLTLGAPGLLKRAEEYFRKNPTPFYEAVVITFTAFRRFILRFSEASRMAGREDLAEMTDFLADHAPETFQQALELGWLYREMQEIEGELLRSMGIFDRQYFRFYQHDLECGLLTPQSAEELLMVYFSHCHAQASVYANMHYCFGGMLPDGIHDGCNDLTRIAFSVYRRLGVVDPKFSLRVNDKTPADILHFAAETIKEGKSAILFINENIVRKTFLRNGKEEQDLANFVPIGCYEPSIMGKELCCSVTGIINLAKIVEQMVADTAFSPENFEQVLDEYLSRLKGTLRTMMDWINIMEPRWRDINPVNAISGTMLECMERGVDATASGSKYTASGIAFTGIGTVADSLAAIRDLVFERKKVSFAELRTILAQNWDGQEKLRLEAVYRSPKWGMSDDRADSLAKVVTETAAELLETYPNSKGGHFQMGLWSIDHCLKYGKVTGATPDGRHAGDTLSKNTCATIGCDREGVAGMIDSVTKLDHSHFANGSVLDVMIPQKSVAGETGTQFMIDTFQTFRRKGGAFMHYNVLSSEALRAAQKEPQKYSTLQIRLCGWNVRFIDLEKDMQDCLIREAEAKEA